MGRLIFLGVFLSFLAQGAVVEPFKIIASGGSPIPTAYDPLNSQSLVLSGSVLKGKHQICVFNSTADVIALNVENTNGETAPAADANDIYIPAGVGACRVLPLSSRVYLRSDSGADIVAGTVYGDVE